MTEYRIEKSLNFRMSAAKKAADRAHPVHEANGDEQRYGSTNYAMSFTKGLDHETNTGLIIDSNDFVSFRAAIDDQVRLRKCVAKAVVYLLSKALLTAAQVQRLRQ